MKITFHSRNNLDNLIDLFITWALIDIGGNRIVMEWPKLPKQTYLQIN